MASPSTCALIVGNCLSACTAARTKNGMKVSLTPDPFSTFSLYLSRSALSADMSTSLNVVRCAVDCCDCNKFSAIRLRRVDIFSRVSRSPGAAPLPPRGGDVGTEVAGRAAAGAGARSALGDAAKTSGFETTPPRPVPETAAMSMPRSSAIRRAAGDDLIVSDCAGVAGAGIALRAAVGVDIGPLEAAAVAAGGALAAPAPGATGGPVDAPQVV